MACIRKTAKANAKTGPAPKLWGPQLQHGPHVYSPTLKSGCQRQSDSDHTKTLHSQTSFPPQMIHLLTLSTYDKRICSTC